MDWKKLPVLSMDWGDALAGLGDRAWSGPPDGRRSPAAAPARGMPAVFIDKAGALTEGDVSRDAAMGGLRFQDGAPQALAALAQAGFALVVVTNQAGIERGCPSRAQFAVLQACIEKELLAQSGVAPVRGRRSPG